VGTGCSGGFGQSRALQTLGVVQPAGFSCLHLDEWQNKAFSFFISPPSLEVDSGTAYKIEWSCVLRPPW